MQQSLSSELLTVIVSSVPHMLGGSYKTGVTLYHSAISSVRLDAFLIIVRPKQYQVLADFKKKKEME